MDSLLRDNKRFIRVKEEIDSDNTYFKCNNNNPLLPFQGAL